MHSLSVHTYGGLIKSIMLDNNGLGSENRFSDNGGWYILPSTNVKVMAKKSDVSFLWGKLWQCNGWEWEEINRYTHTPLQDDLSTHVLNLMNWWLERKKKNINEIHIVLQFFKKNAIKIKMLYPCHQHNIYMWAFIILQSACPQPASLVKNANQCKL